MCFGSVASSGASVVSRAFARPARTPAAIKAMRLSCNPVVPSRLGDPHLPNERLERPEVRHVRRLSKGSDEDATNWVADACSALAVSQRRSGHAGHSPLSDSPPQQSRGAGGTRATANGTSEPQLVNSSPLRESRRVQAEAFANGVPNMAEGENGHSRRRLSAVNVLWERLTSSRFSVSATRQMRRAMLMMRSTSRTAAAPARRRHRHAGPRGPCRDARRA